MLLSITYQGNQATDLGYLLYKNPWRPQKFDLNFGSAYVFYPDASMEKTTASLLLDINPIDLARGKVGSSVGGLFDYVNDRPYVCSSFMSTAISRIFGTAMSGRGDERQELADSCLALQAQLTMLPFRGKVEMIQRIFEPLGYQVDYEEFLADEKFPQWGNSGYVNVTISGKVRLQDLLSHLYVLIPVFDSKKHYWVGKDELEKLFRHGENWLQEHPEKEYIVSRYLSRSRSLIHSALEQLANPIEEPVLTEREGSPTIIQEKKETLNSIRLGAVVDKIRELKGVKVIDLGCGEGKLLAQLIKEKQIEKLTGMDVCQSVLERAKNKLKLERQSEVTQEKVTLFQGSLTYRDERFSGYDTACVIEVIEHMELSRLVAFERVLFEFAQPQNVILTTPNREYNECYEKLESDKLRHSDHRFEWTRKEFQNWCNEIGAKYNYEVIFSEIGDLVEKVGSPTQMGVFKKCE